MACHLNPEMKKFKQFQSPAACSHAQSTKGDLRFDFYGKPRGEPRPPALSYKHRDLIVNGLAKKVQNLHLLARCLSLLSSAPFFSCLKTFHKTII
jgi:hypothetical protein